MEATAKIFQSGNSQAIRLPKAFRVDADEMWIRKNEETGEIIFSPVDADSLRKARLKRVFALLREDPAPQDFLSQRRNDVARNLFADELPARKAAQKTIYQAAPKTKKKTST
jgi:antitoxin VapB